MFRMSLSRASALFLALGVANRLGTSRRSVTAVSLSMRSSRSAAERWQRSEPVAKVVYRESYKVIKPYGCMSFFIDCFMTVLTGGLWLIWVFVREMRRRRV